MLRLAVGTALVVLGAAVAVSVSGAAPPRAKVTLSGRDWATNVNVTFAAPQGYRAPGDGTRSWQGPPFTKSATGSTYDASLEFDAGGDPKARSGEQGARGQVGTGSGWRLVASGPILVPHFVRGRRAGTIKGFMIVKQKTDAGYEGWYKAGLGFSLGKGYTVVVTRFLTTTPGSDSADVIEGRRPSEWNRQAIDQAVRGVAVDGNLAVATIQAKVKMTPAEPTNNARITGRVLDTLGHGVAGVKVTLRKQGVEPCCGATTTATGAYTLVVPKRAGTGAFTLAVTGAGPTLTKTLQVR